MSRNFRPGMVKYRTAPMTIRSVIISPDAEDPHLLPGNADRVLGIVLVEIFRSLPLQGTRNRCRV